MLMPASSEFITLCRTQVSLLIDGFGASLSAIYLTEDPTAERETALIPLVMYPETEWSQPIPFVLPESVRHPDTEIQSLTLSPTRSPSAPQTQQSNSGSFMNRLTVFADETEPTRVVLPLMHDNIMWGLMVVGRDRRRWSDREQSQLEQIAQTLAISCVLDQRSQWLAQGHENHLVVQTQQQKTLSTLLHQFRNPLTTMRTLGKLILKRMKPSDANRDLITSMVDESNHLEHLLRQFDDAIDLGEASLESEMPLSQPPALPPSAAWLTGGSLNLQPCWLSEILRPLLHAIAGRIDECKMQLHEEIPDDLPPVKADPTALREIFGNLIDNALKYTPAGGEIWITLKQRNFQQWVQVSDTGPGIPPEDLERIFERTYRGIQAQTNIPGTGLGLAIARDLATQMEGRLEAYSPALVQSKQSHDGLGSTFEVVLPEYCAE
jgi:signal transduction histidine kinase